MRLWAVAATLVAWSALRAFRRDGKLSLRFPLDASEQLYGLGLNFKTVQQRGTVKQLHVDHYSGSDNGRTHAPVPFYVSSAGYGVLIDAPRYILVWDRLPTRWGESAFVGNGSLGATIDAQDGVLGWTINRTDFVHDEFRFPIGRCVPGPVPRRA